MIPSFSSVLKPPATTIREYSAAGSVLNTKSPCCLVLISRLTPVATCVKVTLAPGTERPDGSLTDPTIELVMLCAGKDSAASNAAKKNKQRIPTSLYQMADLAS
jgi:hypothetical protein